MSIEIGMEGRREAAVTEENTARAMGSGLAPVFATPAMVALMEGAAVAALAPGLEEDQDSVGTHLDVSHLSATPVGMKVWAQAVVTAVEGRTVTFQVSAYDEKGLIGQGTHQRSLIPPARFLARAQAKLD